MGRKGMAGRRGFVLVPLALVLWVALLILGVALWAKTPPAGYVPAKGVGPGQIGSVILAVLYGGFWFYMTGRVAENKSRGAANLTAVITLGFGAAMMGLSYAGLTKDQRGLSQSDPPSSVAPVPRTFPSGAGRPGASALAERVPQRTASSGEGEQTAPTPSPTPTLTTGPTPLPAERGPAPAGGANPAGAAPTRTASDPRADREAEQAKLLEAVGTQSRKIEEELEAEASAMLAAAEKVVPPLVSPVSHDLVKIRKVLEELEAIQSRAKALEAKYQDADKRLENGLRDAGFSMGDTGIAASRWGSSYRLAQRGFGCDALVRTCEKAIEEIGFLKDNFPKWTVNAKGEVRVFEKPLESKISSARFFTRAEAERFRSVKKQIQDGQ